MSECTVSGGSNASMHCDKCGFPFNQDPELQLWIAGREMTPLVVVTISTGPPALEYGACEGYRIRLFLFPMGKGLFGVIEVGTESDD